MERHDENQRGEDRNRRGSRQKRICDHDRRVARRAGEFDHAERHGDGSKRGPSIGHEVRHEELANVRLA